MNKAILFIVGTLLAVVIVVHVSFFLRFDLYQFLGRCKKGYLQHCFFEFLILKVFLWNFSIFILRSRYDSFESVTYFKYYWSNNILFISNWGKDMDIFNKYLSCQNVEKNIGDQLFIEKICLGIHFLAFYESGKVYNSIS